MAEVVVGQPAGLPFSQVVRAGNLVLLAGQVGLRPGNPDRPGGVVDEIAIAFENVDRLLAEAGLSRGDVVRVVAYLTDFADFATMNEAFARFFAVDPPVRTTVSVAALARDLRVEFEVTALAPRASS